MKKYADAPITLPQPVGGVAWVRTIVCMLDAQDLADKMDPNARVELITDPGSSLDYPAYIKSETNILMPDGRRETVGIIVAPDMLQDEFDLRIIIDGEHITPTFMGRFITALSAIQARVAKEWELLHKYVNVTVCAKYAEDHGFSWSSVVRKREEFPRVNTRDGMRHIKAGMKADRWQRPAI